jgi:hypothetical protein
MVKRNHHVTPVAVCITFMAFVQIASPVANRREALDRKRRYCRLLKEAPALRHS